MRYLPLLILQLFISSTLLAQYNYFVDRSIPVTINGKQLQTPFTGGLNVPQFEEIDLNQDGTMDLILHDRSGNRLLPYLNGGTPNTIDYTYAPEYADNFPEIENWLSTGDFNCDGKMDLFIGTSSSNVITYVNTSTSVDGLQFAFDSKLTYPGSTFDLSVYVAKVNKPAVVDVDADGDLDILTFNAGGSQIEYYKNLSIENTGVCGLEYEQRSRCWGDVTEAGFDSRIFLDSCRFDIPNSERSKDNPPVDDLSEKNAKHAGSSMTAFDFDRNGAMDVLIGDISGSFLSLLLNGDTTQRRINSRIISVDTTFPAYDRPIELNLFPAAFFMDVNNDQFKDMIVSTNNTDQTSIVKGVNNVQYYKNQGISGVDLFEYQINDFMQEEMIDLGRGAYPVFFDYNNDGLMDLVVGNEGYFDSSRLSLTGQLALFENTGSINAPAYQLVDADWGGISSIPLDFGINEPSRRLVPAFGDLDGDGDKDMMLGDYRGFVHYFKDVSSPSDPASFSLHEAFYQKINVFGNSSPQLYDLNEDGLLDLILGNRNAEFYYFQNTGTANEPIFNLDVDSIYWVQGTTVRYTFHPNSNLDHLAVGDQLVISYSINENFNNGTYTIQNIDYTSKYIEVTKPFIDSTQAQYNEANSPAVGVYANNNLGNSNGRFPTGNRNTAPFIFEAEGDLRMISGSLFGNVMFFDSISSHPDSNFFMTDTNYIQNRFGSDIYVNGTDLNNDGMIDLAIGNEAGGITIYMANGVIGIDEVFGGNKAKEQLDFLLYPNPTRQFVQIDLQRNDLQNLEVYVFDMMGKIVSNERFSGSKHQLDISALSKGIYTVRVQDTESIGTKRLVVLSQ